MSNDYDIVEQEFVEEEKMLWTSAANWSEDEVDRPESTPKVWKEEEDASFLHHALEELTPSFATLVEGFQNEVEVPNQTHFGDSIVVPCQATLARRQGSGKLPDLSNYRPNFIRDILENTTIFDIELIRVFANHIKEPALTEAIKKHEAALKPLMEDSIAELTERYIVEPVVQDPSKQAYKLVLKCPEDSLVRDLYHARYYLEKYLGIPEARQLALPKD